jgi:hypothetical protein
MVRMMNAYSIIWLDPKPTTLNTLAESDLGVNIHGHFKLKMRILDLTRRVYITAVVPNGAPDRHQSRLDN